MKGYTIFYSSEHVCGHPYTIIVTHIAKFPEDFFFIPRVFLLLILTRRRSISKKEADEIALRHKNLYASPFYIVTHLFLLSFSIFCDLKEVNLSKVHIKSHFSILKGSILQGTIEKNYNLLFESEILHMTNKQIMSASH